VQRREYERYRLWFPVQVAAGDPPKLAMNHNIGAGGMLMALSAELTVGEPVKVTFRLPSGDAEHSLQGRILRIEPNSEDPEGGWPHRVAVVFDEVAPELVPYLIDAVARYG
jgi:hypothetical protein